MGWFEDLSGSSQSQTSGIRVAPETALEQYANPMLQRGLQGFEGLVGAGPGEAQVRAGTAGMEDYARMLQGFSTPEGMFAAQNKGVEQYSRLGEQIFGGQMRQQQQESARMAARMGRPVTDPVLQAKLAQQRADTVGSFAAQQSLQLPGQLAQFGGQRAEALQGLASQAMANRQALLGMGSQLREQDRSYRINTGERYSNQQQAGSFLGSLGAVAGIGGSVFGMAGAAKAAGGLGKLFGFGGGGDPKAGSDADFAAEFDKREAAGFKPQVDSGWGKVTGQVAGAARGLRQLAPQTGPSTGAGMLSSQQLHPYYAQTAPMQSLISGGGFTPDFNYQGYQRGPAPFQPGQTNPMSWASGIVPGQFNNVGSGVYK